MATDKKTKLMNTFRYKSFAERVNEIDLRRLALYHIGHQYEELEEENETYFHQTLKKWLVLNLTEEYNYFSKRCMKIVTLPQLLHQKDFVIDLLLERLATATNLSQQPLLELLYVLARDLREEFYPYFQRVLDRLICLLNTQDAEQLEWTLICLAYLFKSLKPFLKRNIGVVFNAILPLLDEQRYEEHVTNFAVECFAYIARDVRDFPRFLDFILQTVLREQVESVHGCGRLLYELLRGVNGQFHSVAAELLQHVFDKLVDAPFKNTTVQTSLLAEIVAHTLTLLLQFLQPEQTTVLWQKLCTSAQNAKRPETLAHLLQLMLQAFKYKEGRFVCELSLIVPTLIKLFDNAETESTETTLAQLVQLVSVLLQARNAKLSQLDGNRLLSKALEVTQRNIYEDFILQLLDYQQFVLLVLPHVVAYYERLLDNAALELLARIVLHKQPLNVNAVGLAQWQQMAIYLKQPTAVRAIEKQLHNLQLNNEAHLLLLIIAPHLIGIDKNILTVKLPTLIETHLKDMQAKNVTTKDQKVLLLLLQTHSLLKLKLTQQHVQQIIAQFLPLASQPLALGCLQLLFQQMPPKQLPVEEATALIAPLLSAHNTETRLVAAHCLQSLQRSAKTSNPFGCFYAAACIEPNVHNFRELLLQLQQLEVSGAQYKRYEQVAAYKSHTVHFLLGLLYCNFKMIWAPVLQLLADYAKVMPIDDFWQIYKAKLLETAALIDYDNVVETGAEENDVTVCFNSIALTSLLTPPTTARLTQQQALNYRQLLWQKLPEYGTIAEVKNADIVRIFLDFIAKEYRAYLEHNENTLNLHKVVQHDALELTELDDEQAQEQSEQRNRRRRVGTTKTQQNIAKFILQTMQIKLACFVQQPNPKALHRQTEMHQLYLELLAGPNAQLQKLALDCLVAYKEQALNANKEHLYALIDELKFKTTLVNFDLASIDAQQRVAFMKYMLRVLYGKMLAKGTQRQLSAQQRKTLILRFLGQLQDDEILWFLKMAFGRFESYTDKDVPDLYTHIVDNFQLTEVQAPKALQRIVNLLELIRKEFAGRMQFDFQVYVLKLLLFVGGVCQQVLLAPTDALANSKLQLVYRNVKTSALQTLVNYFGQMNNYEWQAEHLASICTVYVWPALDKLPQDAIHTPTPLLKLLLLWGEQTKYIKYLNTRQTPESSTIFHYLITLLLNEKAKPPVRRALLTLIEQLLVAAQTPEYATVAMDILTPHINAILQRLKLSFSARNARQSLDKREMHILTLLTAHVVDESTCRLLLDLLLPIFAARTQAQASEEFVSQAIATLANLIKRLTMPELYLRQLAPYFEQVHELTARKQLCELVADIAKMRHKQLKVQEATDEDQTNAARLRECARIVLLLNAWDKRWVEQPDYDKRMQALRELTAHINADTLDLELGVLVIYNCFYFLRHDRDMGLRVNVSEHLKLLLPHLARKYANDKPSLDYLIGDVFINLVRRTIREANEHVRNEGISLLGEMARQCPESHEILCDLAPLADKHDAEVDFFENMIHIQTQRHGRALHRFTTCAAAYQQLPQARTLTQFLLPLAARYLLNEKHTGKHTLVDAAIEAVGVICQLLPWQQYHTVLRYYLQKLRYSHEYQKQCVRIVVRILDAFHFDLTQAQTDENALAQLKSALTDNVQGVKTAAAKVIAAVDEETKPKAEHEEEQEAEADEEPNEEDKFAADLDSADEEVEADEKATLKTAIKINLLTQNLLLTPNAAKRVLTTITSVLIPTLNRTITEKGAYDSKHKLNRKRLSAEREEEETLRVPIALALVKLMQKLPKALLDSSLPGVFMKVCTFLRSPLKSVRMLTRDILKKIMLTLGGSYLSLLMEHLQSLLTRGFQVHVLSVTVHGVLDAIRGVLEPAHIESCLHNLLEVSLNDIFGEVNAEKEVNKIIAHAPEAKPSAKSFLTLHIAARNIRENCLLDLLLPFREQLARSQSRKLTLKIQECFAKIVSGLVENVHLSRESLLIFVYGTMSESITDLLPGTKKRELSAQEKEKMRRARPDCFIIQPAPVRRMGAVNKSVKSNAQANAHILVEFGLEMLHIVLKRKKLVEVDYQPFVNPLLPLLRDALKSTHVRVTTFALKCFATIWNESYELPSLHEHLPEIAVRIFDILKNFSTFGASRQEDNAQLVRAGFKSVVALLRKCNDYDLSKEQIEQLLLHIEEQLHEGDNQPMCYTLLKALIARKVDMRAIHEIMKRVGELSIVSQSDYVRDETRGILMTYIMEYTLHKRIEQIVKFMSVQLCYTLPAGRLSAIEFIKLVVKRFPQHILLKHAEFLYLSLGTRLVNDEDTGCRRAVAEAIELLLTRLTKLERQPILDVTLLLFQSDNKPSVREMGAALISRFVNAEKSGFAERLKLVLPTVLAALLRNRPNKPGRFVLAPAAITNEVDADDLKSKRRKWHPKDDEDLLLAQLTSEERVARKQRELDHELIQMQYCLLKIFEHCGAAMINDAELASQLDELAYESQKLLAHEHNWVRCNAAKLLTHIISHYDFAFVGQKLANCATPNTEMTSKHLDFIYLNPAYDIKSLVLDLCAQVVPGDTAQEMIDEIVKIFLFIANMLRDVPFSLKQEKTEEATTAVEQNGSTETTKINLTWLVRNIRFLINKEVAKATHSVNIRSALFTLIEGLITLLSVESVTKLAPSLLYALVREMSDEDQNVDADLRQLALRVGSRLRKRIGSELYDKLRNEMQTKQMQRRAERRKAVAQEKIHDPERAAKRKAAIQERKKSSKRLKTAVMRGKAVDSKQKLKKRKRKAELDVF